MSAQRRIVTVLFADVVGSTAIGEELDPEDLSQLLTGYYATAREVIEAYGGTVEKFIGDAVMAVFGAPQAHDDDAHRAVAAGLELRDRVRADPTLGERLPIRIGINTGEVATRASDTDEGQAFIAGDAVNVAARLQQQAEPWSVLVGERTARAAGAGYVFGPELSVEPRGRSAPVSAREALGERAASPTLTPFVGREGDLEQLNLLARRAFADRRPSLVTIIAPPGTGKTRLLQEFLEQLSASDAEPLVAIARCLPYGQQLAYQPLRAFVQGIVGVADGATGDEIVASTRAWLRDASVAQPDRAAELLAMSVGVAANVAPAQATELHVIWRSFVEAAARLSPVVLAIEDLHWASDSLLELIDFAMQPHASVPALLIATARPELFDRRAVWSSGRHNHTTIDLAPLGDEAVGRIVGHVLPEAQAETVASVVERADGNPFFALEISRAVSERPESEQLPDTVQAIIQARLDRLEAADRRIMEATAIFDGQFRIEAIGALTGVSLETATRSVDRLIERGLLVARGADEFATSHVLIRDVAYGALPRSDRAILHRAAAELLTSGSDCQKQPPTELIAVHYRQAATLASKLERPPPELDGIRELAVAWLRRAAESALASGASTEAVEHLQAAADIAPPEQRAAIFERIGDANLSPQSALQAYRRAIELTNAEPPEANYRLNLTGKLLLLVTRSWGGVANGPTQAELDDVLVTGAKLEPLATDEAAVARFLIGRAFVPFWSGDTTNEAVLMAARADAQRGLTIAERLNDSNLRSAALDALGSLAKTWPDALVHARARLSFATELELAERIDAFSTAAWAACVSGELREAEQITAAGLAMLGPGQVPSYALHLVAWRIGALRLLGEWDELTALGRVSIDLWEATERSAAGYATRGFADLLEVARASGDEGSAALYVAVLDEIYRQFPGDVGTRRNEVLVRPNLTSMAAYLADEDAIIRNIGVYGQIDGYERVLSHFLDGGGVVDADQWERIASASRDRGCLVMAAQALRAVGLARYSEGDLAAALELAENMSARPLVDRLTNDIQLVGMRSV
jgi:class 3 adenylate cyclase